MGENSVWKPIEPIDDYISLPMSPMCPIGPIRWAVFSAGVRPVGNGLIGFITPQFLPARDGLLSFGRASLNFKPWAPKSLIPFVAR